MKQNLPNFTTKVFSKLEKIGKCWYKIELTKLYALKQGNKKTN